VKWQKKERREDTVEKLLSADASVSCLLKRMPLTFSFSASRVSANLCDSLVTTTLLLLIHRKEYLRLSNPSRTRLMPRHYIWNTRKVESSSQSELSSRFWIFIRRYQFKLRVFELTVQDPRAYRWRECQRDVIIVPRSKRVDGIAYM
jgi:hypothetical protein